MAYQKVYMNQIYSSSLLCQLAQMWRGDVLCDAIIRTGATVTKAHRVVLVAACPMLQGMDGAAVGTHLEVKLSPDIQPESVTTFLRYLYEGFTMLTEDNVRDLEKIAHVLQVDSITKCCLDFRKVLQSATGQSMGKDPRCHFHADQAEFRHVKASELLRSMNNGVDKRSFDSIGDMNHKRARVDAGDSSLYSQKSVPKSRSNATGSRQVVEDSFALMQTETDTTCGSAKILSRQSASLDVSSQMDQSPGVQVVSLPDAGDYDTSGSDPGSTQRGQSPLTISATAKSLNFAFGGHLSTPQVQRRSPHTISHLVSGMKSKGSSKSEIQSSLFSPTAKDLVNLKSGPAKLPLVAMETKPNGQSDQIIIQPMLASPVPDVDGPDMVGTESGSPSYSSTRRSSRRHGRVVTTTSPQEDSENSGMSTPDLSIVKIEKAAGLAAQDLGATTLGLGAATLGLGTTTLGPGATTLGLGATTLGIPQLGGEDYGFADDGDDGSDMEAYGEGGKVGGAGDEGHQWYIQTLKDMKGDPTSGPGGGQGLPQPPRMGRGSVHVYSEYTDYLPAVVKNWHPTRYSIQAKIVRALSYSKSPIVFLRPLQRKVCGVKVDQLREECFKLVSAGFGKFELKQDTNNPFNRDAFYKPSPQSLTSENAFLQEANITYSTYEENFNDVSTLTEEELGILSHSHPQREDIQDLCVGVSTSYSTSYSDTEMYLDVKPH